MDIFLKKQKIQWSYHKGGIIMVYKTFLSHIVKKFVGWILIVFETKLVLSLNVMK